MVRWFLSAVLLSALLTPEAFAAFEVRGRALGLDEEPVVGRAVLVPLAAPVELGRLGPDGSPLPAPVDTVGLQPDGSFVLRAPGEGLWRVRIEGRGLRAMEALVPVVEATTLPPVYLPESHRVTVVVRGEAGEMIAGALVAAHLAGDPPAWQEEQRFWQPEALLARADDAGRAVLHPGAGEDDLHARAFAPGWISSYCQEMKGATVEIRPGPAVEQRLRVLDAAGRPASGVAAFLTGQYWPLGTTNEGGELTMPVSSSAPLYLALATEELWMNRLSVPAVSPEEDAKLLEFTLAAPLPVSGQVIDRSTGEAVAGALVWVERNRPVSALTDRGGGFSLSGITSSRSLRVHAVAAGYLSGEGSAEEGVPLRIALDPSVSLMGRIVDVEGLAVEGAWILAKLQGGVGGASPKGPREVEARSAADGSFRLARLAPWARYELEVQSPGFANRTLHFATAEGGEMPEPMEVVLIRGGRFHGLVTDEGNAAIAGADVIVVPANERGGPQNSQDWGRDRQVLYTGSEGRFEVLDLPEGRYDLRIGAKGFAPVTILGVNLPAAGQEEIGPVVLEPGTTLEGKVTDRSGHGLEGATIIVPAWRGAGNSGSRIDGSQGELEVQTDADGRFNIPDLAPGSGLSLHVEKEGYRTQWVQASVVESEPPLRVVLEKTLTIAGRLLSPEGEPVERGYVVLIKHDQDRGPFGPGSGGGSMASTWTMKDGSFRFEQALSGAYSLEGRGEGYLASEELRLEVKEEGEEKVHLLHLRWGATVSGRVLDPEGEPVEGARVGVKSKGNRHSTGHDETSTDAAGAYRLSGVEAGDISLRATHADYAAEVQSLVVEPRGHHLLDFVFSQGQAVTGRVVTELGEPVAGARVRLPGNGPEPGRASRFYETFSDPDGSFRFPAVAPGRYFPEAQMEGWLPTRGQELEVSDFPMAGVSLTLRRGAIITGTILGLESEKLIALQVSASHQDLGYERGNVTHEGQYRVGPLKPGPWVLDFVLEGDGRRRFKRFVVEGEDVELVVDVDFSSGFNVQGAVRRGGFPVSEASVYAHGLDVSSSAGSLTEADGSFVLKGLEVGTYELMVGEEGKREPFRKKTTIDGQPIEIELEASPEAPLD